MFEGTFIKPIGAEGTERIIAPFPAYDLAVIPTTLMA